MVVPSLPPECPDHTGPDLASVGADSASLAAASGVLAVLGTAHAEPRGLAGHEEHERAGPHGPPLLVADAGGNRAATMAGKGPGDLSQRVRRGAGRGGMPEPVHR